MANKGDSDTNSSQFYITLDEMPWADDRHVVFGTVIKGFKVIERIAKNYGRLDGSAIEKI